MFLARNRIIAALASITIVVEARERSGALVTASHAAELGRAVGAVPGRTTTPQAAGPHRLLRSGAALITDVQDVLDELFGTGVRVAPAGHARPVIDRALAALLAAIDDGHGANEAIALAGLGIRDGLAALSSLELGGYVRREAGGRYTVVP
jgi:DNA processing protein